MCTSYLLALGFSQTPGDQQQSACNDPVQIQTDFETLFLSILRKNRETHVKISHFQLDFPLNLQRRLSNTHKNKIAMSNILITYFPLITATEIATILMISDQEPTV